MLIVALAAIVILAGVAMLVFDQQPVSDKSAFVSAAEGTGPASENACSQIALPESRRLEFHSLALSEVIEAINRDHPQQIVIDDPLLADIQMSGGFDAADQDAFLDTLRETLDVEVTTSADGCVVTLRVTDATR